MSTVNDGDIVEIVMDVYHVSRPGETESERVEVHGVFSPGATHPPMRPGAHRNVVQVFFNRNMGGIPAFLIETALTEDGKIARPKRKRTREQ
jgi:hypothetical protein